MLKVLFAIAVVLAYLAHVGGWENQLPRALLILAGFVGFLFANNAFQKMRAAQERKDSEAHTLADNESNEQFIVYLRPFYIDPPEPVEPSMGALNFSWGRVYDDDPLVTYVEKSAAAVSKKLRVITLAGDHSFFGPGQITSRTENWKSRVQTLCARAEAIVFVVSVSTGTWWELNFLDQFAMLDKTIFLSRSFDWYKRQMGRQAATREVDAIKSSFRNLGIEIPVCGSNGDLFVVSNERAIIASEELERNALARQLKRVMSGGSNRRELVKVRGPWPGGNTANPPA